MAQGGGQTFPGEFTPASSFHDQPMQSRTALEMSQPAPTLTQCHDVKSTASGVRSKCRFKPVPLAQNQTGSDTDLECWRAEDVWL
jgi:hypothetical protein